jgi:hypothetical protein
MMGFINITLIQKRRGIGPESGYAVRITFENPDPGVQI